MPVLPPICRPSQGLTEIDEPAAQAAVRLQTVTVLIGLFKEHLRHHYGERQCPERILPASASYKTSPMLWLQEWDGAPEIDNRRASCLVTKQSGNLSADILKRRLGRWAAYRHDDDIAAATPNEPHATNHL